MVRTPPNYPTIGATEMSNNDNLAYFRARNVEFFIDTWGGEVYPTYPAFARWVKSTKSAVAARVLSKGMSHLMPVIDFNVKGTTKGSRTFVLVDEKDAPILTESFKKDFNKYIYRNYFYELAGYTHKGHKPNSLVMPQKSQNVGEKIPTFDEALSLIGSELYTYIKELINDGLKNGSIRNSEGQISIYDFLEVGCGKKSPRRAWMHLSNQYPEVVHLGDNLKFHGSGQRQTPVTDIKGLIRILAIVPGEQGKIFREMQAKATNVLLAREHVKEHQETKKEQSLEIPQSQMEELMGAIKYLAGKINNLEAKIEENEKKRKEEKSQFPGFANVIKNFHENDDVKLLDADITTREWLKSNGYKNLTRGQRIQFGLMASQNAKGMRHKRQEGKKTYDAIDDSILRNTAEYLGFKKG